jgi:hypothetical protein
MALGKALLEHKPRQPTTRICWDLTRLNLRLEQTLALRHHH